MGKTGRKNKVYSAEFKISVIMDMREHKLDTTKRFVNIGTMDLYQIIFNKLNCGNVYTQKKEPKVL